MKRAGNYEGQVKGGGRVLIGHNRDRQRWSSALKKREGRREGDIDGEEGELCEGRAERGVYTQAFTDSWL